MIQDAKFRNKIMSFLAYFICQRSYLCVNQYASNYFINFATLPHCDGSRFTFVTTHISVRSWTKPTRATNRINIAKKWSWIIVCIKAYSWDFSGVVTPFAIRYSHRHMSTSGWRDERGRETDEEIKHNSFFTDSSSQNAIHLFKRIYVKRSTHRKRRFTYIVNIFGFNTYTEIMMMNSHNSSVCSADYLESLLFRLVLRLPAVNNIPEEMMK